MKLLFIEGVWMNELTRALSWTLLHSLWQGLALAILAALVILATKKSKAIVRYNLFTGIFFLFILSTTFTFIWQLNRPDIKERPAQKITAVESITNTNDIPIKAVPQRTLTQNIIERLVGYCNAQAPLIVAIWFFVFIVKMVKILSGFGYIQKIRHRRNHPADPYWRKRIVELKQRLMIAKEVLLLQSELIKVPVVIGYFKPVILVPLGLLSQLPPDQVEAVLLHELAHIRRKDYLVNLVQSFAETVFFFNPALLWISELVREERENCCDDIAIGEVDNKNEFIHALVAFQEYNYNQNTTNARLAFPGTKNHLLNRIKRIVYNENKKLNAMEKSIFILSIVTASLLATMSFKQLPAQQVRKSETRADQTKKTIDTVPSKEFSSFNSTLNDDGKTKTLRIDAKKDGKVYRLEKQNDKLTAFYVDGKKIPADQIDSHKDIIDEIEDMHDLRIRESTERAEVSRARIREQQNATEEKQRVIEKRQAEQLEKMKQIDKEMGELQKEKQRAIEKDQAEQLEKVKQLDKELREVQKEKQRAIEKDQIEQSEKVKQLDKELRELQKEKQRTIEKDQTGQSEKIKQLDKEMRELQQEKLKSIEKIKTKQVENEKKYRDIRDDYTKNAIENMKRNEKDRTDQMRKLNSLDRQNLKMRQDMLENLQKGSIENKRKLQDFESRNQKLYLEKLKTYKLNQGDQLRRYQELRFSEQKLLNERNARLQELRLNDARTKTFLRKQEGLLRQERLMTSLEPIISDLKEEKLLDNSDNFSFELDKDRLIVNGKKQSAEVHARYKEKYIKNPGNQYKFSQKGNSKSSTIIEN